MGTDAPRLTIGIPAYNRPRWFEEALASAIQDPSVATALEIVVSDDSTDTACRDITENLLGDWPGPWQYVANQPSLGMAANWNRCIDLARGEYVLLLHDDDFLYPGAIAAILQRLRTSPEAYAAYLFGVRVVDQNQRLRKRQSHPHFAYLPPAIALERLLSNSSFVRFPAIVVRRDVYQAIGGFDVEIGEPADLKMWIQIMGRSGLAICPEVTCAYRVHGQALTMGMFHAQMLQKLDGLFAEAAAFQLLDPEKIRQYQTDFFHQFILAGTYRALHARDFGQAQAIFSLLRSPPLLSLPSSRKWWWVRSMFHFLLFFLIQFWF